jgi:hypothetical protein
MVPELLVLVGHRFGSAISASALIVEPDLAKGVVLIGEKTLCYACDGKLTGGRLQLWSGQCRWIHPSSWTSNRRDAEVEGMEAALIM